MLAAAVTLLLVAEFVAAVAEPPTVPAPVVPPPPLALEPAVERLLAADPLAPVPALDTAAVPVEDVAVLGVVASCSFGSVTAPVPTCPPPSVPGVALVAGVVALVCAATGGEMPSDTNTTRDKIVFKSRSQGWVTATPIAIGGVDNALLGSSFEPGNRRSWLPY